MDIDHILTNIVGGGGRWQWFMVFAMWPITFAACYPALLHMFTAYAPRHRCFVPGCDPEIGEGMYIRCCQNPPPILLSIGQDDLYTIQIENPKL